MSKKKARKQQKPDKPKPKSHRKSLMVIALILCLGLTSLILAQWNSIRTSFSPLRPTPSPTPAPQLSKEYIYAGGKLIATEEPSNTSSSITAPANLTAHAITTTQINLSWASTSASSYLIERSTNFTATNNGFTTLITIDCASGCSNPVTYQDTVPANAVATYLYRVRSVSGSQQSSPSPMDFATTKDFAEAISNQDPPGRTIIKATHITELAAAVNSVRHAAGLAFFTWSDPQGRVPASNAPILRSHMGDLRDGLNQALSTLGFTPQAYSDEGTGTTMPPAGTPVKKTHIDELRQRTKGVGL